MKPMILTPPLSKISPVQDDDILLDSQQASMHDGIEPAEDHIYDVLVIGAGWAGLSAANLLKENGVENLRVLEAKDHIGGRAYSVEHNWEDQKIPLDMGAMWIHGGSKNVINKLAEKYNVKTDKSEYDETIYKENNDGPFSKEEIEKYYDELFEDGFLAYQERRQEWTIFDEPLQKSADRYLKKLDKHPMKKQLAKMFMQNIIGFEYSASMKDMSLHWWDSDHDIGGENSEDYFVVDGHSSLIQPFAEGIREKIVLEAAVDKIDYSDKEIVHVSYKDAKNTIVALRAKKIIVTVPLGVLQSERINFVPSLPKKTMKSINHLGMGKMNKIFMFWNKKDVFWPNKTEVLGDVTDRDSNFLFFNPRSHNGDQPMLYAFFQGDKAEELEQNYAKSDPAHYEERIRDLALESLRSMFGDDIPMPEKVVVTQWNVDEYTMGAYSFNKVGMSRSDRKTLAKPIGRKQLFIAGEATHKKYFATTTGAYLTGRAAAENVLKAMKKN